mmetsp:Transcript_46493/g.81848  ORF Transcript_46493/g.81848 Transcript_46493/m.81848 type:complete len:222 (-) Transcript_46493:505-1170(-)
MMVGAAGVAEGECAAASKASEVAMCGSGLSCTSDDVPVGAAVSFNCSTGGTGISPSPPWPVVGLIGLAKQIGEFSRLRANESMSENRLTGELHGVQPGLCIPKSALAPSVWKMSVSPGGGDGRRGFGPLPASCTSVFSPWSIDGGSNIDCATSCSAALLSELLFSPRQGDGKGRTPLVLLGVEIIGSDLLEVGLLALAWQSAGDRSALRESTPPSAFAAPC